MRKLLTPNRPKMILTFLLLGLSYLLLSPTPLLEMGMDVREDHGAPLAFYRLVISDIGGERSYNILYSGLIIDLVFWYLSVCLLSLHWSFKELLASDKLSPEKKS